MSIVIALVAEKNGRITEIAEVKGKILKTANLIVKKFEPATNDRKCFEENGYYFCVLAHNGTVYLAATASSGNQRLSFQFLETIKNEYEARDWLNKDDLTRFEDYIEEQMDLFTNHPERVDKVKNVQHKVDEAKEIGLSNLGKLLDRGERLENLQEKADNLHQQSNRFQSVAKKLKCLEVKRNIIVTIVLIICCAILVGILIGILYYLLKDK
eukprot:TRINITY_DN3810_c0_g1_i1.p1 TRINITY_DN3810_c0_g1~~TRINITY_DN3810_c0_g1_i1.p1  ORF type:complete len:212 (-),score=52.93 TRINITY_DN3810_c0_g1_i1:146-781(-)